MVPSCDGIVQGRREIQTASRLLNSGMIVFIQTRAHADRYNDLNYCGVRPNLGKRAAASDEELGLLLYAWTV